MPVFLAGIFTFWKKIQLLVAPLMAQAIKIKDLLFVVEECMKCITNVIGSCCLTFLRGKSPTFRYETNLLALMNVLLQTVRLVF
jgi:hypothetical protein